MNFFTSMQRNINNQETFTTSHHNIDTIILGIETPEKSKIGKPVQQSDMEFILSRYGTFTTNR